MRRVFLLATVVTVLLLFASGCSAVSDPESTLEPTEENTRQPATETPPIDMSTSEPTAYPALPTAPSLDDAYPVATPPPTLNPYPGGFAVILLPAGAQCEEVTVPNLSAAISMLEEAGIVVLAAEEIALNVCQACGCPTSEHYRVQIHPEDLETAYELGWYRG